jgi:glyceraldehyde 3-phosphate dehydrogenase
LPTPFAINGLGRMGRAALRIALERQDVEPVAVNDAAPLEQLAGLVARDSLHGLLGHDLSIDEGNLVIGDARLRVFNQPDTALIPWQETPARIVVDATGKCLTPDCATPHRRGSVEKVIVSANARRMDLTICRGINDSAYDPARHHLLSAASCTTNCLAPVAFLLHREYGIEAGTLNTVHSYNNDQRLLEFPHEDPRRARSATLNMVPTTTSAIDALERVLPELAGRLQGFAVRVPTPNVSLVDFVVQLSADPEVDEINGLFRQAAEGELAGILATTDEELVSMDFLGDPHSAIVDLPLTRKVRSLYRVVAWYDNEWGHAARLIDVLSLVGGQLT